MENKQKTKQVEVLIFGRKKDVFGHEDVTMKTALININIDSEESIIKIHSSGKIVLEETLEIETEES